MNKGCVYLVGAGPGDPGLLTVRGREVLSEADVVVYDYLISPRLLQLAPADAERIYVGKKAGAHTMPQEKINELLPGAKFLCTRQHGLTKGMVSAPSIALIVKGSSM